MASSEERPEIVAERVKTNSDKGTTTLRLREKNTGLFLKGTKKNAKITIEALMEATARKLTKVDPGTGSSPFEEVLDSMLVLAINPTEKTASASVKAAEFLRTTAWGSEPKSDLDRNATVQPIKIMIVEAPPFMMNKEIVEYLPKQPHTPSFIDAEVVSTNPSPGTEAMIKVMHPGPVGRTGPARSEMADVEALFHDNEAEINKLTSGVPMSSVTAKAQSDLPLRINQRNKVTQGLYRLAAAVISNHQNISVEVEQY